MVKTYSTNGANKIEYSLMKNELDLYMLPWKKNQRKLQTLKSLDQWFSTCGSRLL